MEIPTLIAIAISSAVQIHILIRLIAPEVGSLPGHWRVPSIDCTLGSSFVRSRMHSLGSSVSAVCAVHTSLRVGLPSNPSNQPTVVPLTPRKLHHYGQL